MYYQPWSQLSGVEQDAATVLGYTIGAWETVLNPTGAGDNTNVATDEEDYEYEEEEEEEEDYEFNEEKDAAATHTSSPRLDAAAGPTAGVVRGRTPHHCGCGCGG